MSLNETVSAAAIVCAWSADVYVKREVKHADALLGPLARGCMTLLCGPRGVGKSWLALAMAHAAARGGSLAGWRARKPHRVVYIDAAGSEAVLHERLIALGPDKPPPLLVLVPGDAQVQGLPDVASAAGRATLDQLVVDADLVVLDGIATLVQAGRGVGARWAALADWLRSLRRRGASVLLAEASEPRALAALADTVLRLERPADPAAEAGLRFTVRVTAARALAEESCRAFELVMALCSGGAVWTRRDDFDRRALAAWRLHRRDLSTREIARKLDVSPATAWRLVRHGKAMPKHVRDRAELPELEEERRRDVAHKRAEARRKAERQARLAELAALEEEERMQREEAETAARTDPHPPPSPASGGRCPSRSDSEPSPACGLSTRGPHPGLVEGWGPRAQGEGGQGEGGAAVAVSEEESAQTANSPEAVKHPPATIEQVATDDLLPVLLARRRWWKLEQPPPPDWLAKFDYQALFHEARSRLTGRGLNKVLLADDKRPFHPRPVGARVEGHLVNPPRSG